MSGLIDFAAGVGQAGFQLGHDALRSMIEEEKASRLMEMQQRHQVARDEAGREFQRGERVAGEGFRTTEAQRKRQADLEDAPVLAGIQTDARVRGERETRALPPAPLTPEDRAIKEGQARYYGAGADRLAAETDAIRRGERYGAGRGAAADRQAAAAVERAAAAAASALRGQLRGEKDPATGAAMFDSASIARYEAVAGALVRNGHDPQSAVLMARGAPVKTDADLAAELKDREAKISKVGMIRGALTFGGVESGDVEVGGKTMKVDEWRKAEAGKLRAEADRELAQWARGQGISLPGIGDGGGAGAGGLGYNPDRVRARVDELRKSGVSDADIAKEMDADLGAGTAARFGLGAAPRAGGSQGADAPAAPSASSGTGDRLPRGAKWDSPEARDDDRQKREIAARRKAEAAKRDADEEAEREARRKQRAERAREEERRSREWNATMSGRRRPSED